MGFTEYLAWFYGGGSNTPGCARNIPDGTSLIDIKDCMVVVKQDELTRAISCLKRVEILPRKTVWKPRNPVINEMQEKFEQKERYTKCKKNVITELNDKFKKEEEERKENKRKERYAENLAVFEHMVNYFMSQY